jgi:dTDP-4-dehydrorhamnose 3,5-epimerase
MIFNELPLKGAYVIEPEKIEDERGFFARSFCSEIFREKGLEFQWVQSNISYNLRKGTLRGMHYQLFPHAEIKLVRCTAGAIYDVLIDLRAESPTFKQWIGIELSQWNRQMLYIPAGFAHGFQTLKEESEVFYQMSSSYEPSAARGVLWNDPVFQISWPLEIEVISPKDRGYSPFVSHNNSVGS